MSTAPAAPGNRFDAIVIGASAGGIEVLSLLLPALPADLRAAIFVVLHQPPNQPSVLVEIFARKCVLPVREPEDKEPVEPGTIYFAPPNYHLLIEQGATLALSIDALVRSSRPSIDVTFQAAADAYRHRLLAILLTGWNEDGTAGLLAVRAARGTIIVQDPLSAEAPVMPQSAIQACTPDYVLEPRAIADLLRGLTSPSTAPSSPAPASPAP